MIQLWTLFVVLIPPLVVAGCSTSTTEQGGADNPGLEFVPENLGPIVNSSAFDGGPSISNDGLTLYFASERPGGLGEGDLWVTKRPSISGPFGPPQPLGSTVNSASYDACPGISPDGLSLFFCSRRSGGFGDFDLWVSRRATTADSFGPPQNLGPTVNTAAWEGLPDVSADGLTLFFDSNRAGGLGSFDIWMTTRATTAAPWGAPENVGAPINSSFFDVASDISPDGLVFYFTSDRPGGSGGQDLWVATRPSVRDSFGPPQNLGTTINSSADEFGADRLADGLSLVFASTRSGGSGDFDLWRVRLRTR
jgi:Tol biopolymer transport system component